MNVLHIIPSISPYYGGPSKAVVELCAALQHLGVNTTIATTNADGEHDMVVRFGRKVNVQGVSVFYFRRQFFRKPVISLSLIKWLKYNIKHYDMLHIHGVFSIPASVGALLARRSHTPYVVGPCGTLSEWSLSKKPSVKKLHLALVGRDNLNGAAALHVTSEGESQEVQQLKVRPPVIVIPLGIVPPTNANGVVEKSFKQQLDRLRGKKIILFLSRIDPVKGLDLLITAVANLLFHRRDFILIIAGAGQRKHMEMLKQLIIEHRVVEHVVLTDFVQGAHKEALLQCADIFILPSYHENFGIAVVEAMSRKLPVVISNQVDLYPEVLTAGAGIVTPCAADAVMKALNTLLNDELLCRQMGENGFNLVTKMYTWDNVAVQIERFYRSILSGRSQEGRI